MTTTATPTHVAHRRAKIVCTLGPATEHRLADLIVAGMDVARLNFSHGNQADHQRVYCAVREAADTMGRTVAVLADLQGPKIRLRRFTDGPVPRPTSLGPIRPWDGLGQQHRTGLLHELRPGPVHGRARVEAPTLTHEKGAPDPALKRPSTSHILAAQEHLSADRHTLCPRPQ